MTRFTNRFRAERGAADPILTIGAITVSLILAAGMVASIIWIVNFGSTFFAEQKTTTNLSQARDAFAKDAQNASAVTISSGTQVTFFEPKSGSAASTRSTTASNNGCRVSQWNGVAAANNKDTGKNALQNTVWNLTDCPTTIPTSGGVKVLSVDGFNTVPQITAANASGRTLYANGVKAGTIVGKPSTYLTNAEWQSTVVKNLSFSGTLLLAIEKTAGRTATINGTTRLADAHALTTPGPINEPDPIKKPWDASAPTSVSATQSSTAGKLLKGFHEGLDVKWKAAYCGPYIVKYDVTVTNAHTATQKFSLTDYYQPIYSTTFTGIPNGTKGSVTVTATCPNGTSATSSPASYQMGLGAPTLNWAQFLGAETTLLKWTTGDLSSAPVWYQTQARNRVGQWFTGPDQQNASQYPWGWAAGAGMSYGTTDYRVLAHVDGAQTPSNVGTLNLGIPAPSAPGVWNYDSGGAIFNNTIGWSGAGCVAGTHPEYNPVVSGSGQGWRQTNSLRIGVRYATWYSAYVQAHCISNPYGVVGAASASGTTSWRTNDPPPPVPNAPGVSGTYNKSAQGGGSSTVSVSATAYATQYEVGSILFGARGDSGWSSRYVSSSGSYTGASICETGNNVIGGTARARAGGVSGWSGYNTANLRIVGGNFICN